MGTTASVLQASLEFVDSNLRGAVNQRLFSSCKGNTGDNLFTHSLARDVFVNYMKRGQWRKKLGTISHLYDYLGKPLSSVIKVDDPAFTSVFFVFIFPSSITERTADLIFSTATEHDVDDDDFYVDEDKYHMNTSDIESVDASKNRLKSILLGAIFLIFLGSIEYTDLVRSLSGGTDDISLTASPSLEAEFGNFETKNFSKNRLKSRTEDGTTYAKRGEEKEEGYYLGQPVMGISDDELDYLLASGRWTANLFSSVENLKFCVTLATADRNRPGFPLIYVNKAFEMMTGYKRSEIVGQNCRFLQGKSSEKEQIQLMSRALATAQPIKLALTNRRKDGSEFFNLLSMKPVFNKDGDYCYVLGVQYEYTQSNKHAEYIQLVDDLLSILPSILI